MRKDAERCGGCADRANTFDHSACRFEPFAHGLSRNASPRRRSENNTSFPSLFGDRSKRESKTDIERGWRHSSAAVGVRNDGVQCASQLGGSAVHAQRDERGIADQKQVRLLKAMDPANHVLYSELKKQSGPAFDREYLLAQVNIHSMGNGLYDSEAKHGENVAVRDFAARNTPVGVEHLDLARRMAR